jgi:hypothetical protein
MADAMAGVVLRAQDENNYYVVRASTEGNLLWYRVVGGKSYDMLGIGVKIPVPKDVWQELRVECKGSRTRCFLEASWSSRPPRPARRPTTLAVNDTTFAGGKIGFWCKADTQCSFVDASVQYTPKVPFAEVVVAEIKKKYPRLAGFEDLCQQRTRVAGDCGRLQRRRTWAAAGTKYEADVIERGIHLLPQRRQSGGSDAALARPQRRRGRRAQNADGSVPR